ncbi:MAG: response regulator transcription factor [Bacteroidia bacterium]|nr:response regulator transcription factor [Bacteroidia bacterium]
MVNIFHIVLISNQKTFANEVVPIIEEDNNKISIISSEKVLYNLLDKEKVDLILMELDFKPKDGITLTGEIKNNKKIKSPHIMLYSNKLDDYIQIIAYNSGVDDYISSNINPKLLRARISSIKKRLTDRYSSTDLIPRESNFYVDKEQYVIHTSKGKISLPKKEFELLNLMYKNNKKVFTRKEITMLIWNLNEPTKSRRIDTHIRNIRKILGKDVIKTVKGKGYSINNEIL